MNKDLKDPARVMFFPYVVNAYNIYVLIKEMASHWPSMKEIWVKAELKRATISNSSLQTVQKHED